jgi:hypothetical protein
VLSNYCSVWSSSCLWDFPEPIDKPPLILFTSSFSVISILDWLLFEVVFRRSRPFFVARGALKKLALLVAAGENRALFNSY